MLNLLIDPLKFEFMRNAIAVGILLGIVCAVVGSYLIVQQMGMMVDMIAHSVLAGLPVAFSLGFNISIGAFISGIISAIIMAWIQSQSRIKIDAVMALILSTFLAISVTLISVLRTTKIDLLQRTTILYLRPARSTGVWFACKLDLLGDDFGDYTDDCGEFANCGRTVSNFAVNRTRNYGVFVSKRVTFNDGSGGNYWNYS
jgi:hypothetical protein